MRRLAAVTALLAGLLAGIMSAVPASAATGHSATYRAWHFALAHHGAPYEFGAAGPAAFDCSGLVSSSYRAAGIALPRDTYEMLDSRMLIPVSHPSTGNLAFFGSGHVELYVRPGWTYGAQHTGTAVGYHHYDSYYHPTAFYRVAGAG